MPNMRNPPTRSRLLESERAAMEDVYEDDEEDEEEDSPQNDEEGNADEVEVVDADGGDRSISESPLIESSHQALALDLAADPVGSKSSQKQQPKEKENPTPFMRGGSSSSVLKIKRRSSVSHRVMEAAAQVAGQQIVGDRTVRPHFLKHRSATISMRIGAHSTEVRSKAGAFLLGLVEKARGPPMYDVNGPNSALAASSANSVRRNSMFGSNRVGHRPLVPGADTDSSSSPTKNDEVEELAAFRLKITSYSATEMMRALATSDKQCKIQTVLLDEIQRRLTTVPLYAPSPIDTSGSRVMDTAHLSLSQELVDGGVLGMIHTAMREFRFDAALQTAAIGVLSTLSCESDLFAFMMGELDLEPLIHKVVTGHGSQERLVLMGSSLLHSIADARSNIQVARQHKARVAEREKKRITTFSRTVAAEIHAEKARLARSVPMTTAKNKDKRSDQGLSIRFRSELETKLGTPPSLTATYSLQVGTAVSSLSTSAPTTTPSSPNQNHKLHSRTQRPTTVPLLPPGALLSPLPLPRLTATHMRESSHGRPNTSPSPMLVPPLALASPSFASKRIPSSQTKTVAAYSQIPAFVAPASLVKRMSGGKVNTTISAKNLLKHTRYPPHDRVSYEQHASEDEDGDQGEDDEDQGREHSGDGSGDHIHAETQELDAQVQSGRDSENEDPAYDDDDDFVADDDEMDPDSNGSNKVCLDEDSDAFQSSGSARAELPPVSSDSDLMDLVVTHSDASSLPLPAENDTTRSLSSIQSDRELMAILDEHREPDRGGFQGGREVQKEETQHTSAAGDLFDPRSAAMAANRAVANTEVVELLARSMEKMQQSPTLETQAPPPPRSKDEEDLDKEIVVTPTPALSSSTIPRSVVRPVSRRIIDRAARAKHQRAKSRGGSLGKPRRHTYVHRDRDRGSDQPKRDENDPTTEDEEQARQQTKSITQILQQIHAAQPAESYESGYIPAAKPSSSPDSTSTARCESSADQCTESMKITPAPSDVLQPLAQRASPVDRGPPASIRKLYARGLQHHKAGELDAAVSCYEQAIRLQTTPPQQQQQQVHQDGDDGNASHSHEYASLYINLGSAWLSQHRYVDALTVLRHAEQLQPESTKAAFNSALALLALGRGTDAAAQCHRVLALDPTHAGASHALQQCQPSTH